MKRMIAITAAMILTTFSVSADDDAAIANAERVALYWLALTDAGRFYESWDEASTLFQAAVTRDDWYRAINAARTPLGGLVSRNRDSAIHTGTLPGAPDGEYVVFQYASAFDNKAAAVETITAMKDVDDAWKVSGYFIK